MRSFEYIRPRNLSEATEFLDQNHENALLVAGGTAAVVMMRLGIIRPEYVCDIGGVSDMTGVSISDEDLRLGALTTIRLVERDEEIFRYWPHLSEAASQVGNVRVRNMATLGGALSYGEPQTDTPVALLAMRGSVIASGVNSSREIELDQFFVGPYETALAPGEILSAVKIPRPKGNSGGCHVKFTVGSPENKPVANASAAITLGSSGEIEDARLVVGAVGPTPFLTSATNDLVGHELNEGTIRALSKHVSEEIEPIDDVRGPAWYKRRITQALVEDALICALQRAKSS